jgi:hypothetical protein
MTRRRGNAYQREERLSRDEDPSPHTNRREFSSPGRFIGRTATDAEQVSGFLDREDRLVEWLGELHSDLQNKTTDCPLLGVIPHRTTVDKLFGSRYADPAIAMTDSGRKDDQRPAQLRFQRTYQDSETGEESGWVEVVNGAWCAAWLIEGGAVAEMRIYPASARPSKPGGQTLASYDLPEGGISAALHRDMNPGTGRNLLALWRRRRSGFRWMEPQIQTAATSGGGRGVVTPEALLAQIAVLYEDAVGRGVRAPAREVARQLRERGVDRTDATVRDLIHRARKRGFLTKTPERRAHGHATTKAHEVLRKLDTRERVGQ